jgi:hypothetical protein
MCSSAVASGSTDRVSGAEAGTSLASALLMAQITDGSTEEPRQAMSLSGLLFRVGNYSHRLIH